MIAANLAVTLAQSGRHVTLVDLDLRDPSIDRLFGIRARFGFSDLAQGVERYFEFVQKAVDINRELATTWAGAVTSFSGVVREQTEKAGQLVTEQTDKARELTTEQADKVESATRDQVDKVEQAEKAQVRRVRQATNGHTNGHSDEQNERLIDSK